MNLLMVAAAYIGFVLPKHAMGDRYLASAWPFLALLLAGLLGDYWRHMRVKFATIVFLATPALSLALKAPKHPPPPAAITGQHSILVDFDSRGSWPAIFLKLDPSQPTRVANQFSLLNNQQWQDKLSSANEPAFYISGNWPLQNSASRQKEQLKRLDKRFDVEKLDNRDRKVQYFRISPSTPGVIEPPLTKTSQIRHAVTSK